jgi:hypothetical protein
VVRDGAHGTFGGMRPLLACNACVLSLRMGACAGAHALLPTCSRLCQLVLHLVGAPHALLQQQPAQHRTVRKSFTVVLSMQAGRATPCMSCQHVEVGWLLTCALAPACCCCFGGNPPCRGVTHGLVSSGHQSAGATTAVVDTTCCCCKATQALSADYGCDVLDLPPAGPA